MSVATRTLETNDIRATVHADGILFSRPDALRPGYETPPGSGAHTLFGASLWIGGIDERGRLRQAAMTYRQRGSDFFPGPIRMTGQAAHPQFWNRIYFIDRAMVESHRNLQGPLERRAKSGDIPDAILQWPANGPQGFDPVLAPFVDLNQNNRYDPDEGEYPYFEGDEALYMIFNDAYDAHTESLGRPLKVEVHATVYAYWPRTGQPRKEVLNNTIFVDYRIINRSSHTYDPLYLGQWVDFDIGGFYDDYIGTDPNRNMCYGYNADDWDSSSDSITGYGDTPPAQAMVFLNQPMRSAVHYRNVRGTNDGIPGRNEYHYYNYLRGRFLDGTERPQTHSFPGNPCTGQGGTTQIGSEPYDQRMVAGSGPFRLAPGENIKLSIAFVTGPRPQAGGGSRSSVCSLQQYVDQLRVFASQREEKSVRHSDMLSEQAFQVYPNPVAQGEAFFLESSDRCVGSELQTVQLLDQAGRMIRELQPISEASTVRISTQNLAPGIYALRLYDRNGSVAHRQVVIQ